MAKFSLTKTQVIHHQDNLVSYLNQKKMTGVYLSSFDIFLNEYVPLQDCLRYYVTGFTGSVAEALLVNGTYFLFVDGRYHEQADIEVVGNVEVVKVAYGVSLEDALFEKIKELEVKELSVVKQRTSYQMFQRFSSEVENIFTMSDDEIISCFEFSNIEKMGEITSLSDEQSGETTKNKLNRIFSENKFDAFFVSTLDGLSWLTNLRGFQLPFQSTFTGKALATKDTIFVFSSNENVEFARGLGIDQLSWNDYSKMKEIFSALSFNEVAFDETSITVDDFLLLLEGFGEETVKAKGKFLVPYHACKNNNEIKVFEDSFEKSDMAIWNSLNWLKKNSDVSELDFFNKTNEFYKKEGAVLQSFNTIAGFGPSSSIIHFSKPSDKKIKEAGEIALLDSGAFYHNGALATDCTRTILSAGEAKEWQKEIYTLVLKGLLHAMNATFEPGTPGKEIDAIARGPIQKAGYDYAHGTGHGVGINVHEGGFRLTPVSETPLLEGRVGSIEPGIYLPGKGGVRLENIVVIEKVNPKRELLKFRSFVHIGFDPELIEFSMLDQQEKNWLQEYESLCSQKGRSFMNF